LAKKEGRALAPIKPEGRKIASSFWGQAWCENLERYSDFENRLPRGRSYIRNGSVIDLQIERGKVKAIVAGSEIYRVTVSIRTLAAAAWKRIKQDCSQSIDSLTCRCNACGRRSMRVKVRSQWHARSDRGNLPGGPRANGRLEGGL
jgi:hypothetical protein